MSRQIVLYGRPGCHLCEEAEQRVRELAPAATLEVVDIEADDELLRKHLERIPVICVDGAEIATLDDHRRAAFAETLQRRLSN